MGEYYLVHHGIKGQKWGIRRFQNEDGSLTPAGMRRYGVGSNGKAPRFQQINRNYSVNIDQSRQKYKDAKQTYRIANAKTNLSPFPSQDDINERDIAKLEARYAREDFRSEKIKNKLNNEREISKHRQKLEAHYKAKGMNDEEAAIAAYKRDRTEKIVGAALGITVAAASAYLIYKHREKTVDRFLSADEVLKRVSASDTTSVHDGFYAALEKNKMDVKKYKGMYGETIAANGNDVFQKTIKIKDGGLKIASEKSAIKELQRLAKNPEYLRSLDNAFNNSDHAVLFDKFGTLEQQKLLNKARYSIKQGKIDSAVYRALNLMGGGSDKPKPLMALFSGLKSQGFDAVGDLNDKFYSGYKTKNPLIVFNAAKTYVDKVEKLNLSDITQSASSARKSLAARAFLVGTASGIIKSPFTYIAAMGTFGTAIGTKLRRDAYVKQYREEHPNTKLSYNEIVRNYERNRFQQ